MDTSYDIKTRITDNAGNGPQESSVATIKTVNILKPVITISPTTSTYLDVTVTITYPIMEGGNYEYRYNGISWTKANSPVETFTISQNDTIYARITDSTGQTGGNATYSITNIDKAIPGVVVAKNTKYLSDNKIATIPKGFKVSNKSGEYSIDTGLVVIAPDNSEFVWVPVSSKIFSEVIDETNNRSKLTEWRKDGDIDGTPITYSSIGPREPSLADSYYDNNQSNLDIVNSILGTTFKENGADSNSFLKYMQDEWMAIKNSIKVNGGFYIGRYETQMFYETSSKPGMTGMGNYDWYTMYAKQIYYGINSGYGGGTTIKSNMIYGFQWDATMKWFTTSANDVVKKYPINGGYNSDLKLSYSNFSGNVKPTGSVKPINNIYDMAGNVHESTVEANNSLRSVRGYYYDAYSSNNYFTGYRHTYDLTRPSSFVGSRLALYI